jgi:hypothetical protein
MGYVERIELAAYLTADGLHTSCEWPGVLNLEWRGRRYIAGTEGGVWGINAIDADGFCETPLPGDSGVSGLAPDSTIEEVAAWLRMVVIADAGGPSDSGRSYAAIADTLYE